MKRIISIVLIVTLLCVAGVVIYNTYQDNKAESMQLEEISEQIIQLNIRKSRLEESIEETRNKRDEELRKGNYMVLFFDNLSENLYTDVYPLLESFGHKGTIVMKDSLIPGEEGNISTKNFNALLEKGWDLAIGCDSSIDMSKNDAPVLLAEYLDNYIASLTENGIDIPNVFCFDKGGYGPNFEKVLKERGFEIIRHYGETGETYASTIGNDFYYIGSGWYCAGNTALENVVVDGYEKEMTYSVSTRYIEKEATDSKLDCTIVKYRRMLDYFETYCENMEVCTVSELYEKKKAQLSALTGVIGEYNSQIAEYEKELNEIDEEMRMLYSELS